ncbi:MAG: Ig-like domain-containing protein, partial [Planctomycetota bacterium]
MRAPTYLALVASAAMAACGGSGGSAGSSTTTADAFGVVQLLSHAPADGAVQVALDATIELEFDAPMALESFGDEDTWLRVAGAGSNVPGEFRLGAPGRVRFTPAGALAAETDYVFQLSALTCDESGRILDVTTSFGFRTFDATPPQIAAVDVAANATNVDRARTFTITFNEGIKAASVGATSLWLRDLYGFRYAADLQVAGAALTLDPLADLPGDRAFFLIAGTGLTDRAGNALAATSTTPFRTAPDSDPPAVTTAWPEMNRTGVSPLVQPTFTFDESMDPATVEAASLLFQDEFGSIVPFAVDASPDQRTLRLRPTVRLANNRRYTIAFLLGGAAATDVSGNALTATAARTWTTGTDVVAPVLVTSTPASGETRVPGTMTAVLTFDSELDPERVGTTTVALTAGGAAWAATVERPAPTTLRVTPILALPTDTPCVLTVRGGQAGVRDLAGNVLAIDLTVAFTTSGDGGTPTAMLLPPDGAAGVATSSRVSVVFDAAMDAATVTPATVQVTDDLDNPLPGTLTLGAGNRVASFVPASPFAQQTWYRIRVLGGSAGPRRTSGNWLPADRTSRFRTIAAADTIAPTVTATVNSIHASRREGLVLPPSGFTIDVTVLDAGTQFADIGSVRIELSGGGTGPGAETLLAAASLGLSTLRVRVPAGAALAPGSWTLAVRAADLSGNVGQAPAVSFQVVEPRYSDVPFETPQVVWLRTDMDRDSNGSADFDDDLLRLGLAAAG